MKLGLKNLFFLHQEFSLTLLAILMKDKTKKNFMNMLSLGLKNHV